MTDKKNKDQQELLRAIDAAMAGGEDASYRGDPAMLDIARHLSGHRPAPSSGFLAGMDAKIDGLAAGAGAVSDSMDTRAADVSAKDKDRGPAGKWLPSWLTLPRMAAAVAVLVVGLGIAGLTQALINGQPSSVQDDAGLVKETGTPAISGGVSGPAQRADEESLNAFDDAAGAGTGAPGEAGVSMPGAFPDITGSTPGAAGLPETSRVIQNADYEVEVPRGDFDDRFSRMSELAAKYGGFIVTANSRKTGEDEAQVGSITMRIATTGDNFARAQAEIEAMGGVKAKDVSGVDVTEEYVDLQSRLRSAEAQEAQMLELLKRAETIDEILTVQSRLAEIQSQIEQIKGRIKYVESRTDFATIAIDLREEGVQTESDEDESQEWGFVGAIKSAAWLAVQTVNFVILALGIVIPALLISLLFLIAGYRIFRSKRFRHGA
jgi:hypothetical protein